MNQRLSLLVILFLLTTSCLSCPPQCTSCDSVANCLGGEIKDIPKNFPHEVKILDLSNNQITELSSQSFQELPSLTTLRMSGNRIIEISHRSFISLPSLMSLDLSNNPTVQIEDRAFEGLAKLRMLSITNTKITKLGKSLRDLSTLHSLNMGSNQIEMIQDENFEGNEELRMLDLSQNQITQISTKAFVNLKYLRYLSLSSNPIVRVSQLEFSSSVLHLVDFTNCLLEEIPGKMPESVADYRLGNNKLTEVKAENFENITNLRLITLNNNQIKEVEEKAFGHLENLMEIWLSNNKLKFIPRLLPRNLQKLFLDHNEIYEIGRRIFPINSKLEVLSLDTNKVERISDGAWGEMPMLKRINLNANKLKIIKTGAFSNISTLECLKLSNNPIEMIETGALKDLNSMNELSLSYLNAQTTQLSQDFPGSLAYTENINFVNSPGLVKSFLGLIENSKNVVLSKTKVMSLQYNELENLPKELKEALPNVEKLFIDGNPWYCDTRLSWLMGWMKTSDILFYKNDPPECEAPKNLQGREITGLNGNELVEPREVTTNAENSDVQIVNRGDVSEIKVEKTEAVKKTSKTKKNRKIKNGKNGKNKKTQKGENKRDRIKRRHNDKQKRCITDVNGRKICPRRLRKCVTGSDGKKICPKKNKKIKNVKTSQTTTEG